MIYCENKYRRIVGCLGCSPLDFNQKERREGGREERLEKLNIGEIGRTRKEGLRRNKKKKERKAVRLHKDNISVEYIAIYNSPWLFSLSGWKAEKTGCTL